MRGYYGIGVWHPKYGVNIGTLWRSAYTYGAAFLFTVGRRYHKQASDTYKSWRSIPLWHFDTLDDFFAHTLYSCPLVCVELADDAHDLRTFTHPERCVYLLGAEDHGLPEILMKHRTRLQIPSALPNCLNVATAGSIILYDRYAKESANVV